MLIKWDESDEVGVEVVEAGHRLIIELINRVNAAEGGDAARAAVSAALAVLGRELPRQFLYEENALVTRGAESLQAHRSEHRAFVDGLAQLREQFMAGRDVRALLLVTLVAFLNTHQRGSDHDFVSLGRGSTTLPAAA